VYILYEYILTILKSRRGSSVLRGARRLLIERGQKGLELLFRDDESLAQLRETDLKAMLNGDQVQQSNMSVVLEGCIPWIENRDGEPGHRRRET
jgi:hypothetical protein